MSYLSLYRKWRPGTFGDVLGQDHVTETLVGAIREDRISHAYVFSGPRGTGKTSTARILAKALNCERGPTPTPCGKCRSCVEIADGTSLDVFEMDAASHTSVDDVREIRERIPFASAGGARKVYIIDEAHQLSTAAFNALLKMLEEPPPHVVFVLCTTESHKLPATVVSRCQRFDFRRHTEATITEHLSRVAGAEDIKAETEALVLLSRHAQGSMRDPLALLDQAAGTGQGIVTKDLIVELLGDAPLEELFALSDAIAAADVAGVFRRVDGMVARGWDPRNLLRQLLEHFRTLFLVSNGATDLAELPDTDVARYAEHVHSFTRTQLEWVIRVLGEAQADVRASTHPRLTLEVTLARAASLETTDTEALMARIERLERAMLHPQTTSTPTAPPPPPVPKDEVAPKSLPAEKPVPTKVGRRDRRSADAEGEAQAETVPAALEGDAAQSWHRVLEEVKAQSKVTYTHLSKGHLKEVTDDAVVVAFSAQFHAEQLKRPDQLAKVVAALSGAFGRKMRFVTEIGEAQAAARPEPGAEQEDAASPDELVVRGLGADLVEERDA